jgi:hypothetical protein
MTPPFGPNAASEIAEFLTGKQQSFEVDRVLTSVLFTDIVASTETAASMGDQHWRRILDSHDRLVREQLRHFRGREIKTTGDGFLASFDGPPAPYGALAPLSNQSECLGSRSEPGCTPESVKCEETTSAGWPFTSPHALARSPDPERSSSRAPSRTSSWGPTSPSPNEANISSRACPGPGSSSP